MSKDKASDHNHENTMPVGQIEINTANFGQEPDLSNLPVLPTRNLALFPGVTVPLGIGREGSLRLAQNAADSGAPIAVICQVNPEDDTPSLREGLFAYGVLADVYKVLELPDGSHTAIMRARDRFRVLGAGSDLSKSPTGLAVRARLLKEIMPADKETFALTVETCRTMAVDIIEAATGMEKEFGSMLGGLASDADKVNYIATNVPLAPDDKRAMLGESHLLRRAELLMSALYDEKRKVEMRREIMNKAGERMQASQRSAFLQQQLETIKEELYGSADAPDSDDDSSALLARAAEVAFPEPVRATFEKEVGKLRRLNPQSPDYSVQYSYLETLLELPWNKYSTDPTPTVAEAREVLEAEHFGLDKVKQRILEQIAVVLHGGGAKAPILCLVGPPGVGKTSLGRSIARAMGRKYGRVSLGGVHDEAEIRGHRRTYVGSLPGRIIKAVKTAGVSNPVLVLDEIDKIGRDHRGDPADALLEVLDPEQNKAFHDNYIDLDFDLSHVLFIATANTLSTVPQPLLDRMEIIELSGYLLEEKMEIACRHILPRVLADNNLPTDGSAFSISDAALTALIERYTSESGVRQLEKRLASLVRKSILASLEGKPLDLPLQPDRLKELLGLAPFTKDKTDDTGLPGVVTGLAWTQAGGEILLAEASLSAGKGEKLTLTGNLGDVMKESATIAYQWVRSQADVLGIKAEAFDDRHLHVHFPEGAIPKDGPSAGITIATAIASAYTGRPARADLAMTGEITLRGRVLPVGGVKEKILAAKRAGVTHIVLSDDNRRDIEEIPAEYLSGLEFHYVKTAGEVVALALR